jgi:hypothetical protein
MTSFEKWMLGSGIFQRRRKSIGIGVHGGILIAWSVKI